MSGSFTKPGTYALFLSRSVKILELFQVWYEANDTFKMELSAVRALYGIIAHHNFNKLTSHLLFNRPASRGPPPFFCVRWVDKYERSDVCHGSKLSRSDPTAVHNLGRHSSNRMPHDMFADFNLSPLCPTHSFTVIPMSPHNMNVWCKDSVAKRLPCMLNTVNFDPWQRSVLPYSSTQRTKKKRDLYYQGIINAKILHVLLQY